MTIPQICAELERLRVDILSACDPASQHAAQCAIDRIAEAVGWLQRCRPRPLSDPNEVTPIDPVARRPSGQWPKVGG